MTQTKPGTPTSGEESPDSGGGSKLPPKVTSQAGPDQKSQEQMIKDYYALAPQDPDAAFQWLLPEMQASSGNLSGYKGFWDKVESAKVEGIEISENLAYSVQVKYTMKDKTVSKEKKFVVLRWIGDAVLIQREQDSGKY